MILQNERKFTKTNFGRLWEGKHLVRIEDSGIFLRILSDINSRIYTASKVKPSVQRGKASNRGLDGEETHGELEVWQRLQAHKGPHGRASTRQGY